MKPLTVAAPPKIEAWKDCNTHLPEFQPLLNICTQVKIGPTGPVTIENLNSQHAECTSGLSDFSFSTAASLGTTLQLGESR